MHFNRLPWPLSELTPEEASAVLKLPEKMREGRINQLKRDIASGAHARRKAQRELDAARESE